MRLLRGAFWNVVLLQDILPRPKCAFFLELCEFCQNSHKIQYINSVGKAKKTQKKIRNMSETERKGKSGGGKTATGNREAGHGERRFFLDPRGAPLYDVTICRLFAERHAAEGWQSGLMRRS